MELLSRCYVEAPVSYCKDGAYRTCGRCLTLLTPLADGGWWCERDACRRKVHRPSAGRSSHPKSGLSSTSSGRYASSSPDPVWPTPLRQRLAGLRHGSDKLHVELWPGFDAYDLRVTFPNGHIWALDVKDWRHPALLGRSATPLRPQPRYDCGCWVVPQEQVDAQPGYLTSFYRNRPTSAAGLALLTDDEVIKRAQARLRGSEADLNPSSDKHRGTYA